MSKIALVVIVLFILLGGTFFYLFNKPSTNNLSVSPFPSAEVMPQEVDFTASFAIYTNGTFRIFSDKKYHNLSPDVFIQADNANVVNVKKAGTTWNDFFKTLPMKLSKDCLTTGTGQTFCTNQNQTLKFYINGEEVNSGLEKEIKPEDKLLISYGSEHEDQIKSQLQKLDSFN